MIITPALSLLLILPTTSKHPPSNEANNTRNLPRRQLLQLRQIPIKNIRIPPISITIRILPNSLIRPPTRNSPRTTPIPRQHKRTSATEGSTITRAGTPPVIRAVDERVAASLAVVGGDEALDPGDHGGGGEAVAGGAVGVVFDVEHPREGDAVAGPAAAVGEEEGRLRCAGGFVRVGEVVAAPDEAGVCGAGVVGGEFGVFYCGAFCCLGERVGS